jgi:hypothetical protein
MNPGWIAVDLDGVLAEYHGWDDGKIGKPVPRMIERVKGWLKEKKDVRIFTARVANDPGGKQVRLIQQWCKDNLGHSLLVTCEKNFQCVEIWDDRAVQVIPNTGERADGKP